LRVGIVGAGISGLAAGRTLHEAGHSVTLFEKSTAVGGRCATRRVGDYTFDTGVTSIAPRGRSLEKWMFERLSTDELVKIEKPIHTLVGSRVSPGDSHKNRIERYCYRGGNTRLPKLLAEGLDIRFESLVARFQRKDAGFDLNGEEFDALILTPPAPQASALLEASGESRPIQSVTYRPCLSVLLGFAQPLETNYHALIEPEQRHPLTWLSVESAKCPDRAPEGHTALVAQLSPAYSRQNYDLDDAQIVIDTCDYIERIYGSTWGTPAVSDVKRWRYSLPESLSLFEKVNSNDGRLLIAGDSLLGGRVEFAFETGVQAAQRLM
jgi:predicted NAD/FAD-dependent oxidoreductase